MMGRLRELANRPVSELPTGLVLIACVLVIVLGAVIFAQIRDPERRAAPRAEPTATAGSGEEVTHPPVVTHETHPSELPSDEGPSRHRITRHDGRDIRTSTRRFMAGYLAFTYGEAAAIDITNATRELIAELEQNPPRVPEAVRRRRPGVELVHLDGAGAERAAAVAIVNDGVTRYSVHVRLIRTGMEEWSVTDVGLD